VRLSDHQAAFTADLAALVRMVPIMFHGYRVRILETGRSVERQQELVATGRSWVGNVFTAPHVEKRAADLALDKLVNGGWQWQTQSEDYQPLGVQWELLNIHNRWGGRYGDGNHFERLKSPRGETEPLRA
jgi:hypothetical protein